MPHERESDQPWTADNYFRTELLMAVGQSFAFVGLVATIVLQAFFSGALDSPSRVLTFSAFFHVVRLFAGQVGVTVMARFIAEQEKLHSYPIGLHVQTGDWIADQTLRLLAAGLSSGSTGAEEAADRAVGLIASGVRGQAYTLAFIDAFHLVAWMSVAMLILLATLGRFPLNFRDLATLDAGASTGARWRPVMTVRYSILALLFSAGASQYSRNNPSHRRPAASRFAEAVDMALTQNHAVRLASCRSRRRNA